MHVKTKVEGKPIRIEEFEGEHAWWGEEKDSFKTRVENGQAWRVSIDTNKAGNFNPDTGPGVVDHLLPEYEKLLAQIAATRGQLKEKLPRRRRDAEEVKQELSAPLRLRGKIYS